MSDARWFFASSLATAVLDVVRAVLTANLLGPYLAGLCATMLVIPQVGRYLGLGLAEALTVVVPYHRGAGNPGHARTLKSTVFTLGVSISVFAFATVVVYAIVFSRASAQVNGLVLLAGSLIVLWGLRQFFATEYAVEHDFGRLGAVELGFAGLACVLQVAGVYLLGAYGFFLGLMGAELLTIAWSGRDYLRGNVVRVHDVDVAAGARIVPLGVTLLVSAVAYAPFVMTARVFLAASVGVEEVGVLIVSTLILGKIAVIPTAVRRVLVPRMSLLHGAGQGAEDGFALFLRSQLSAFAATTAVILAGLVFLAPAVTALLPAYTSGIPAARVTLLAGIPYSLIDNAGSALLALQEKRAYVESLVAALALEGVIFGGMLWADTTSAFHVAFAFLVTFAGYAALLNYRVLRLHRPGARPVRA